MFDLPRWPSCRCCRACRPWSPGSICPAPRPQVAAATLAGRERRLDLLRTDSGSVTLHAALLGGLDPEQAWRRGGAGSRSTTPCSPMATRPYSLAPYERRVRPMWTDCRWSTDADPADGRIEVAVAVPVLKRRLIRPAAVAYEVRRARGRAVSVIPRDVDIRHVDDGVVAALGRKRAWWIEAGAWGTYVM